MDPEPSMLWEALCAKREGGVFQRKSEHLLKLGRCSDVSHFLLLYDVSPLVVVLVVDSAWTVGTCTAFPLLDTSRVMVELMAIVGVNLFAERMGDRYGRKRILVAGWLFGFPMPLLLIFAPSWGWVIFANVLLGINQSLCSSTTVIMKIDQVGPSNRGLAMGFNEAAGYLAVALAAFASGYLAATSTLRPQPFFLGVAFAVLSVRETRGYDLYEATSTQTSTASEVGSSHPTHHPSRRFSG